MNNPNLIEDGIATRFSKDNQPENKKKQVPKWRTKFKEMIEKDGNLNALEEELKKGNIRAWEFVFERILGKVKEKRQIEIQGETLKKIRELFF